MLSGLVSSVVNLEPPQVPRSVLDNPDSLIPNNKFVYVVPDWLEKKSREWEDSFIQQVQSYISGPVVLLTRILKVFHTVWTGVMAVLFFYLAGYDRCAQLWASHMTALLAVSLSLKRLLWRHRPYAVRRVRMALALTKSSSFPSRSVLCSLLYVYLCQVMMQMVWENLVHLNGASVFQRLVIPTLFFLAGLSLFSMVSLLEIVKGVHYPSDCVASLILAMPVIALGGWLQSLSTSLYPVLTLNDVVSKLKSGNNEDVHHTFLDYKEMKLAVLIKWGLIGAVVTMVLHRRAFLNWDKMYRFTGVLTAVCVALTSLSCDVYSSLFIPPPSVDLSLRTLLAMLVTAWLIQYLSKRSFILPERWWGHIFAFFFVYCSCLLAVSLWRVWLVDHKPLYLPPPPPPPSTAVPSAAAQTNATYNGTVF